MNLIKDVKNGLSDLECNQKQITSFAIIISLILAVVTYLNWSTTIITITAIGVTTLILIRLINWRLLIIPFKIWMGLALFIGWFVMRLILIIVFILIIFPISLIFRITRKDPMGRFNKESYWYKIENAGDKSNYLKKF